MPMPQPPRTAWPARAGVLPGGGATWTLEATLDDFGLKIGPPIVDQASMRPTLPALKALTSAVKSYESTPLGANFTQSTMCCRASTAGLLVRCGVNVLFAGDPLMSLPPMVMKRVYQSTRNIDTSADLATSALPETPPLLSALAALRYAGHVVGTLSPALSSRSLR